MIKFILFCCSVLLFIFTAFVVLALVVSAIDVLF